jgi:hypothetical protein
MKKLLLSALGLVVVAGLQGCSSPAATCALEGGGGRCMSMQAAYDAVRSGASTSSESVFGTAAAAEASDKGDKPSAPQAYGYLGNYPEPDKATPVFQQPKVFRPWLAPYVDADGVLHSGEYAYFNTPGAWNYGELRKPGAGGAVMGPVKPWEAGFIPSGSTVSTTPAGGKRLYSAPPAPPAVEAPRQSGAGPASTADAMVHGITQPYQRLD